jgi:hypothetical protein
MTSFASFKRMPAFHTERKKRITIKGIVAYLIFSFLRNLFILDSAGGNESQMDMGLG